MNAVIQKAIVILGSQSELALRVGVRQSTVSKWLNGAAVSPRYIHALAQATDGKISTSEILDSFKPADSDNTESAA